MEKLTLLTNEALDANNSAFRNLVELIQSGDAILMAGAGCSGALFPAWSEFIEKLKKLAQDENPDFVIKSENDLVIADQVKDCVGVEKYYSFISDTFKPGDPPHLPYHELLCRIPFKAITTTNYDTVLESAYSAVFKEYPKSLHFEGTTKSLILDFLQSLNFNKRPKRWIVHLHGIYSQTASIVLGSKEYSTKYGFELGVNNLTIQEQLQASQLSTERINELLILYGYQWPLRRKLLWSLLATRRIVFIGFSMSDPYFSKMLEFVKNDLSTYNAETHFLVLRVTPKTMDRSLDQAARLKREYGIQTVFFQDEDGSYTELSRFIAELENEVNIRTNKVILSEKAESKKDVLPVKGDTALTNTLFSLSKKQYSDED